MGAKLDDDFNLIYHHRHTGEAYRVKRITKDDYVIRYPDTLEERKITKPLLDKGWKADKSNGKRKKVWNFNFKKKNEKEISKSG